MPHWRTMTDSKYFNVADLADREGVFRDQTHVIDRVEAGVIEGEAGRKSRKPFVYFRGISRPLGLAATNAKTISRLYGSNTDRWAGKAITLYAGETSVAGEKVECVRIRPVVPEPREARKERQDRPREQAPVRPDANAAGFGPAPREDANG